MTKAMKYTIQKSKLYFRSIIKIEHNAVWVLELVREKRTHNARQ